MMINNQKTVICSFFIILLVNIIVFFPSFDQAPRGSDHYHYLVETSHIDNLSDRLVYSYSYPRIRKLASGDEILFRPIFYIFLSIETWLFQYNSFYWQAAALLLHMLVLWQILKILRLITQGLIPFLLVLCFSTLYISQEMVTWHHINGYMLFLIFFLRAFYHLLQYYIQGNHSKKHLLSVALFLTLACFTCEIGIIYTLVLFFVLLGYFWKDFDRPMINPCRRAIQLIGDKGLLVFFIPIANYAAISFADYRVMTQIRGEQSPRLFGMTDLSNFNIVLIFQKLWNIVYLGIGGVLFPCFSRMFPYSKTRFDGFSLHPEMMANQSFQIMNVLLVLFAAVVIIKKTFLKPEKKDRFQKQNLQEDLKEKNKAFFISKVSIAILISHIILLIGGRSQTYNYITFSLYHYYILGVFALLSCSGFLYRVKENSLRSLTVFLCFFIFLNGYQTHRFNQIRKAMDGSWNHYIQQVSDFVTSHKNEKSFSFNIFWSERRKSIDIYEGSPDNGKKHVGFLVDFLFRQYIDTQHPRYFLIYSDTKGLITFQDEPSAKEYFNSIKETLPPRLLPSHTKD